MRAAIVITGDEVLRGLIQERNAGVLARSLDAAGVELAATRIVGDDMDAISGAVADAVAAGVDLVVTSGGLGPTHDDITMEAVAAAAGVGVAVDPEALALVRARQAGLALPGAVRDASEAKQASLPRGSRVLAPVGTAPGCTLEIGRSVVVVLPGPPWELEAMWETARGVRPVADALARAGGPRERVLRLYAVPESRVVGVIDRLPHEVMPALRVGICAKDGELEITVRHPPSAAAAADALEAAIADEVGESLYSRDGATLDETVARLLVDAGHTVAVAESCTGGGLGARLTDLPGSSAYVVGGVISYSDEVKRSVLGVDPEVIRRDGAVSAECARQMAGGARALVGSDWALSVTGIAGPGGGTREKPVGLVYVGLAGPAGVEAHRLRALRGDRATLRRRSAAVALHLLRIALEAARRG